MKTKKKISCKRSECILTPKNVYLKRKVQKERREKKQKDVWNINRRCTFYVRERTRDRTRNICC